MKRLLIAMAVVIALAALPAVAAAQDATDSPVASSPNLGVEKPLPDSPSTFGTSVVSYYEIPANAFQPWNTTQTYTSQNFGRGPRYPNGTSAHDFVAPLRLPSGAKLTYLELDYIDTSASAQTYGQLADCNFLGTSCNYYPNPGVGTADCTLTGYICSGTAATTGASGSFKVADLSPSNIVINNYVRSYSLLAEPQANDGSEQVGGMIVGYVLQVSPAPGVASFPNDVPTSHPFFRFVEALHAAGVTAGCGPGSYCPDQPVTRGQMAVFISTALGLQWN